MSRTADDWANLIATKTWQKPQSEVLRIAKEYFVQALAEREAQAVQREREAARVEIGVLWNAVHVASQYAPKADSTCNEPGITFAEAVKREVADAQATYNDNHSVGVDKEEQAKQRISNIEFRMKEIEDNGGSIPDYLYDDLEEAQAKLAAYNDNRKG
jgi:hypothetical protein